ncbi:unnamed protein product [Prorocentrum cordatum]|uniref:Uncharacterized protein n=1 Tax=Prorocentrum cordatum TaxID=2364126 RepID=A0ABN9WML3_9DINO|nr:unnamed protein product [Polarella glacialis]
MLDARPRHSHDGEHDGEGGGQLDGRGAVAQWCRRHPRSPRGSLQGPGHGEEEEDVEEEEGGGGRRRDPLAPAPRHSERTVPQAAPARWAACARWPARGGRGRSLCQPRELLHGQRKENYA